MKDEIKEPKETKKCLDCGQEGIKNMGVHARYCKGKKQEPKTEHPEKEQPEAHKLIISDVQQAVFDDELVAWFDDGKGKRHIKEINHIGIVHSERGSIPAALVVISTGEVVPPYLIEGFIGLFSGYYQFPESGHPIEETPKIGIQNEFKEPIKATQSEEIPDIAIKLPSIHAQEPKKESFLAGIFGKKEKTKKTTSDMTNSDIASEIIKASNGGTA